MDLKLENKILSTFKIYLVKSNLKMNLKISNKTKCLKLKRIQLITKKYYLVTKVSCL